MSNLEPEELKITIETGSRIYSRGNVKEIAITFESLMCAITEVYAQANQIGLETKVLDDLTDWIRKARERADTAA